MKLHALKTAVCVWVCVSSSALATTTVTLTDSTGDAHSVSVAPGGSFVVNIVASASEMILVIEGDLIADTANILDVTALSYGDGWDPPGSDFGHPFTYAPPYGLDTTLHIGSGRPGLDGVTGSFTFATISVLVDASAAPGTYTLRFTPTDISDESFSEVDTATGPDYQIIVASAAPPDGGGGGGGGGGEGGGEGEGDGGAVDPGEGGSGGGEGEPSPGGSDPDTGTSNEPPTEQPDTGAGNGPENPPSEEAPPAVVRPLCGAGVAQSMLLGVSGLFLLQGGVRRQRRPVSSV